MNIIIEIIDKNVKLILKNGEEIADEFAFPEEYNISEKLLPAIDELLEKHKLTPEEIDSFSVDSNLGESYTSRRIAEAVANAFNWGKTLNL